MRSPAKTRIRKTAHSPSPHTRHHGRRMNLARRLHLRVVTARSWDIPTAQVTKWHMGEYRRQLKPPPPANLHAGEPYAVLGSDSGWGSWSSSGSSSGLGTWGTVIDGGWGGWWDTDDAAATESDETDPPELVEPHTGM